MDTLKELTALVDSINSQIKAFEKKHNAEFHLWPTPPESKAKLKIVGYRVNLVINTKDLPKKT